MSKRNPIDLLEAQKVYDEIHREKHPLERRVRGTRCPKNCRGRIKNKGNCTSANCILLDKEPVALAAVKVAQGKKKRIPKLARRDRNLLAMISPDYKYRTKERPIIKKQLKEAKGLDLPRLNPRANFRPIRHTWPKLFEEYNRITGKTMPEKIMRTWKKLGKRCIVRMLIKKANKCGKRRTSFL